MVLTPPEAPVEPVAAEAPAPEPAIELEPPVAEEEDSDELVLGSETQVPEVQVFGDEPEAELEPQAPEPSQRRRWLSPGAAAGVAGAPEEAAPEPHDPVVQPAPRVKLGGTLFERMSSVSRGAAREDEPEKDPVDIPRFLHRQNNQ